MSNIPEDVRARANALLDSLGLYDPPLSEAIAEAFAVEREAQRERDAKIADEYPKRDPAGDGNGYWAAEEIAAAIRAHKAENRS